MSNQGLVVWIYAFSSIIAIVGYVAILVFAIARRGRDPGVTTMVVGGLILLLAAQVFGRFVQPVMVRLLATSSIPVAFGITSLAMTVVSLCGVSCIVLAALKRPPEAPTLEDTQDWFDVRPTRSPSDNPYEPPA